MIFKVLSCSKIIRLCVVVYSMINFITTVNYRHSFSLLVSLTGFLMYLAAFYIVIFCITPRVLRRKWGVGGYINLKRSRKERFGCFFCLWAFLHTVIVTYILNALSSLFYYVSIDGSEVVKLSVKNQKVIIFGFVRYRLRHIFCFLFSFFYNILKM